MPGLTLLPFALAPKKPRTVRNFGEPGVPPCATPSKPVAAAGVRIGLLVAQAEGVGDRLKLAWVPLAIVALLTGCTIRTSASHFGELMKQAPAQPLSLSDVLTHIPATTLKVPGRMKLEVTHRDPIVSIDDFPSYAKLVRFTAGAHQQYDLEIDSWCDCPVTAILWSGPTAQPTVFVPTVTVLDANGTPATSVLTTKDFPEWTWRQTTIRTRWTIDVEATGPYYVLITSAAPEPQVVRLARNWSATISAPVGKMGLKLKPRTAGR